MPVTSRCRPLEVAHIVVRLPLDDLVARTERRRGGPGKAPSSCAAARVATGAGLTRGPGNADAGARPGAPAAHGTGTGLRPARRNHGVRRRWRAGLACAAVTPRARRLRRTGRSDRSDGGVLVGDASPALGWRLPKWLRTTKTRRRLPSFAAAPSEAYPGLGWPPPTSTPPSLRSDPIDSTQAGVHAA